MNSVIVYGIYLNHLYIPITGSSILLTSRPNMVKKNKRLVNTKPHKLAQEIQYPRFVPDAFRGLRRNRLAGVLRNG
jgi:hypothetical protein